MAYFYLDIIGIKKLVKSNRKQAEGICQNLWCLAMEEYSWFRESLFKGIPPEDLDLFMIANLGEEIGPNIDLIAMTTEILPNQMKQPDPRVYSGAIL